MARVAEYTAAREQQREAGCRVVGRHERECPGEVIERRGAGITGGGVFTGLAKVVDRVDGVTGALVVFGNQAEVFARAVAAAHHEPVGRLAVVLALVALEHTLIGDLMQHMVLEHEFVRALEGAGLAAVGELASHQAVECIRRAGRDAAQGLVPEHVADHARLLQRSFLAGGQAVDAGLQHAGECRRHMHVEQLVGDHPPLLGACDDNAVVDQHADEFFDEVWISFRAGGEQIAQRGRHGFEAAQQGIDEFAAAAPGEWREFDALVVALAAAPKRTPLE